VELPLALFSFSKYVMRVALLFGPRAPCLAASAVAHLSGSRVVPWSLVLRLFASAELCSTRRSDPGLYSRYFDPVPMEHHHLASQ
jgi:hypothetical protein